MSPEPWEGGTVARNSQGHVAEPVPEVPLGTSAQFQASLASAGDMGQSQGGVTTPDPSEGPPPGGQEPSPLERGLHAVVGTFYQYARAPRGGGEPSLDPPAFQRLLRRELGHQLSDTGQPQAVASVFALLDANRDRRISFDEYWQLVAWLCHVLRHRHYGATQAPPPPHICGDPDPTDGPHPAPGAAPLPPAHGDGHQ